MAILAVGPSFSRVAMAQPGVTVPVDAFYNELAPYGQWIQYPQYGSVWMPNVDPGFQPYATAGHWVMTDYGNTWVSDYPWGWAAFHYGRWIYDPAYGGWLWVPGSDWAPAWVTWRSGGGYYGWAPLAPGWGINVNINIPAPYWTFVPQLYITSPNLYSYCVPRPNIYGIYQQTYVLNNVYRYNNWSYNFGPARIDLERITRRSVPVYRIDPMDRPGRSVIGNGSVGFYRPGAGGGYGRGNYGPSPDRSGYNDRYNNGPRPNYDGDRSVYNRGGYNDRFDNSPRPNNGNNNPSPDRGGYNGGMNRPDNNPNGGYGTPGDRNRGQNNAPAPNMGNPNTTTPDRGGYAPNNWGAGNNGQRDGQMNGNSGQMNGNGGWSGNNGQRDGQQNGNGGWPGNNGQREGQMNGNVPRNFPQGGFPQQPNHTFDRQPQPQQNSQPQMPQMQGGQGNNGGFQRGQGAQPQALPQRSEGQRAGGWEGHQRGPR